MPPKRAAAPAPDEPKSDKKHKQEAKPSLLHTIQAATEYERYRCTNATEVKAMLAKYGVAILSSVIDHKACDAMANGMWTFLEHITSGFDTPITRDNKLSWREFSRLYPKHSMLLQQWSIGHAQFLWDLRQNPQIVSIFATLWGCRNEDLLVSFDGASFHLSPEITGKGWFRNNWLHCDQSFAPKRHKLECIQSWITAFDVDPGDATLTFLEGSHLQHEAFAQAHPVAQDTKGDWYKLLPEEQNFYTSTKSCPQKYIACKAGDMVFWDSRTIHSGQEAVKGREHPKNRCVAYLCYTPRKLADTKQLKKKIKALQELRTTSHWPHKPIMFPKMPRTYGKKVDDIKPIPAPVLTSLGKRLAGH